MKHCGLEVEILWSDEHVIELRVTGRNGRFSAVVEVYTGHGELDELASAVRGFPVSNQDLRAFEVADFDIRFEPAALDDLVATLGRMRNETGTKASVLTPDGSV